MRARKAGNRTLLPDRWPLFWFELRRAWRRERWITLGVCVLLLAAPLVGDLFFPDDTLTLWALLLVGQSLVFTISSPAGTMTAISGEAQRGTLDALLLTPLSNRELLMSKLGAALLPRLLVIISCALPLPIQALCGNRPALWPLLSGYLALCVLLVCGACIGLAASCRARHAWDAQVRAFLQMLGLLVLLLINFSIAAPIAFKDMLGFWIVFSLQFAIEMFFIITICVYRSLDYLDERRYPV